MTLPPTKTHTIGDTTLRLGSYPGEGLRVDADGSWGSLRTYVGFDGIRIYFHAAGAGRSAWLGWQRTR